MNALRSILERFGLTRIISEEEIRRDHLLQLRTREDGTPVRQQLCQKWRRFNLAVELHLARAAWPAAWPESNLPVAHSSLTLVEGFRKARAIFKDSIYAVYCVAGNTTAIEPLLGRDSIAVFEKIGPGTLSRQPLQRGDIVIANSLEVRSLHQIKALNMSCQEFTANQAYRGAVSSIESRLVAVFYTRPPDPLRRIFDHANQPTLLTDCWDDAVFRPASGDKPTPHSGVALWGTELERARRVFPWPTYLVYADVRNTNSMEPLLDSSAAVIFETLSEPVLFKQSLRPGDIITWASPTSNVLHRIIGQAEDGASFYIRGDNNWYGDSLSGHSLIPQQRIIRRVVAIIYGRQIRQND